MLVKQLTNLALQSGTFPSGAAALMMSRVAEQRGNVHAASVRTLRTRRGVCLFITSRSKKIMNRTAGGEMDYGSGREIISQLEGGWHTARPPPLCSLLNQNVKLTSREGRTGRHA